MWKVHIKRFCFQFRIELIFLVATSLILALISQICLQVFLNTFRAKHKNYSSEIASIILRDMHKLMKADAHQKLDLDIIKNYQISPITPHEHSTYLSPDVLKLIKNKKMILIDLHYLKHLIAKLYNNNIKIDFIDIKPSTKSLHNIDVLYETPIIDNITFVSYLGNVNNELTLKARKTAYLSSLAIVIILTSFYIMIRKLYLCKDAVYIKCQEQLTIKEVFRTEYIKLTKLLYKPIVSKLKSEIYYNGNQEPEVNAIFSVVSLEDSRININEFFASLSSLFYVIEFKFHTETLSDSVNIGVNYASFCQIIYSFMNHIHNSLGDTQRVDLSVKASDANLVIKMIYTISEFANKRRSYNNEELLHPFLIGSTEIFEILNRRGIYCQSIIVDSQCTIEIKLPLRDKTSNDNVKTGKDGAKTNKNNVCHIKDYHS